MAEKFSENNFTDAKSNFEIDEIALAQEALNNQSNPPVVIYRYILLQNPITINEIFPFVAVFAIYCIVIHSVLTILKKIHKPSYNFLIFLFVVIFPPVSMMILSDYLFLLLWISLLFLMLYCLRIGFSTSLLAKEGPRVIYSLFKSIFTFTSIGIAFGQFCIVFSAMLWPKMIKIALRILIYFLYFAVFCREIMINLSKIMAKTTGFYNKEGIPGRQDDREKCMICVTKLSDKSFADDNKILTLGCGHSFHSECLKGWTLIGNNKFCIYCKKGIDMTVLEPDLWSKAELAVKPLMNGLRSSISFFVVIYLYMVISLR